MTRAVGALLGSLLLAATPNEGDGEAVSRWRHNPRGRTEAGLSHQESGQLEAASDDFSTALALAPADPLLRFNAGTAELLAEGDAATELLRAAAEEASPGLKPIAYYNLGNAQLAARQLPEAIDSYKESLRHDPANMDVKHNLELAQRMLEEQQQDQQSQEEQEDQEEQQQDQQQQDQQQQDPQQDQQQQDQEQEAQQQPSDSPLPEFEDQPEMTAEQAAAILEAVENLEREQRRQQAMQQLKRAKGDRDW